MAFELLPVIEVPEGTHCPVHADKTALWACRRCGTFACRECSRRVTGVTFCTKCLENPEVDYVEATRRKYAGKRGLWMWYLGLSFGLGMLGASLEGLRLGQYLWAVAAAAGVVVCVAYLWLKPWARPALIGVSLLPAMKPLLSGESPELLGSALGTLFPLVLVLATHVSVRNRLAFRLDVSERELDRLYRSREANPLALRSAVYGGFSVFLPLSGFFTLWMGISALKRSRNSGWPPPVGNTAAKVGIALSIVSILVSTTVTALLVFARKS